MIKSTSGSNTDDKLAMSITICKTPMSRRTGEEDKSGDIGRDSVDRLMHLGTGIMVSSVCARRVVVRTD